MKRKSKIELLTEQIAAAMFYDEQDAARDAFCEAFSSANLAMRKGATTLLVPVWE